MIVIGPGYGYDGHVRELSLNFVCVFYNEHVLPIALKGSVNGFL
jgi:hypothetical protein